MQTDQSIPVIHMSVVSPMMDMLDELGAPLAPGLTAAHMPSRIIEERDGYVPFKAACTWANREARNQGIDNIGLRAEARAGTGTLHPGLMDTITASPTLYKAICTWADLIHRESSHCAIWVDDNGDDLRLRFSSTFAQDVPGQADWIWFATAMHTTVVKLFLGPGWCPPEMVVPEHGRGQEVARKLFPGTRLITHPEITGITIPRDVLSARPLATNRGAGRQQAPVALPSPPVNLEESLAELVRLYLPDGPPGIAAAAEAAGVGVRTLQRRLAARSLSYEQLVSNLRFEQARLLLEQGALPITEIARQLGYRHSTHFARAFRRIAGVSPREYRRGSVNPKN